MSWLNSWDFLLLWFFKGPSSYNANEIIHLHMKFGPWKKQVIRHYGQFPAAFYRGFFLSNGGRFENIFCLFNSLLTCLWRCQQTCVRLIFNVVSWTLCIFYEVKFLYYSMLQIYIFVFRECKMEKKRRDKTKMHLKNLPKTQGIAHLLITEGPIHVFPFSTKGIFYTHEDYFHSTYTKFSVIRKNK